MDGWTNGWEWLNEHAFRKAGCGQWGQHENSGKVGSGSPSPQLWDVRRPGNRFRGTAPQDSQSLCKIDVL